MTRLAITLVIMVSMVVMVSGLAHAEPTGRDIMVRVDNVDTSKDATMVSAMVIERGDMKLVWRHWT